MSRESTGDWAIIGVVPDPHHVSGTWTIPLTMQLAQRSSESRSKIPTAVPFAQFNLTKHIECRHLVVARPEGAVGFARRVPQLLHLLDQPRRREGATCCPHSARRRCCAARSRGSPRGHRRCRRRWRPRATRSARRATTRQSPASPRRPRTSSIGRSAPSVRWRFHSPVVRTRVGNYGLLKLMPLLNLLLFTQK